MWSCCEYGQSLKSGSCLCLLPKHAVQRLRQPSLTNFSRPQGHFFLHKHRSPLIPALLLVLQILDRSWVCLRSTWACSCQSDAFTIGHAVYPFVALIPRIVTLALVLFLLTMSMTQFLATWQSLKSAPSVCLHDKLQCIDLTVVLVSDIGPVSLGNICYTRSCILPFTAFGESTWQTVFWRHAGVSSNLQHSIIELTVSQGYVTLIHSNSHGYKQSNTTTTDCSVFWNTDSELKFEGSYTSQWTQLQKS